MAKLFIIFCNKLHSIVKSVFRIAEIILLISQKVKQNEKGIWMSYSQVWSDPQMMIVENKYKIFLVENSIFIRNKLMELLPELGFEIVGMAGSSKYAFRYIAETRPEVVLLDMHLPDITTEEAISGLLSINPNLAIVLMGPLSDLKEVMHLMQRGASDYIPKPLIDNQIEYILRKYEFSHGIKPVSKIETIAQIYSIFLNDILEQSPRNIRKHLEKAVKKPLKRLNSRYKDRYEIIFDPIRIKLLQKTNVEDKVYKMYYNQLNRLYISVLNNLNKELPEEYVKSLLLETFHSFYSVVKYLIEGTNYQFPKWKGFQPKFENIKDQLFEVTRIDYNYEEYYPIIPKEYFLEIEKIKERIDPYRIVVHHDPRLAPKFPKPTSFNVADLDLHLVLSYFDDILGPTVATVAPPPHGKLEADRLNSIPRLLDTIGATPNEPFIHAGHDFGSVNVIFSVNFSSVRGGSRDYMLSVVITPVEIRSMVRIHQMRSILRATASLLNNYFKENPDSVGKESIYVASEPHDIINDLYDETMLFLSK